MVSWKLAPVLTEFRRWNRAKWPKQTNALDGTIGDENHSPNSGHMPNARGIVRAVDEDERGVHFPTLMVAFAMHPSARYMIYERRIWHVNRTWRAEEYTGTKNPHAKHGHYEIHNTVKAENSKTLFNVTSWATLHNGVTGRAVSELQMYLNVYAAQYGGEQLYVDGHFGDKTEEQVKRYQDAFNVPGGVDGIVGVHTEYHLKTNERYHVA